MGYFHPFQFIDCYYVWAMSGSDGLRQLRQLLSELSCWDQVEIAIKDYSQNWIKTFDLQEKTGR